MISKRGLLQALTPLFLCCFLTNCAKRVDLAPVSELSVWTFNHLRKTHVVQKGETLYAIAFGCEADYRQLAAINHLRPPYVLSIGQVLSLQGLQKKRSQNAYPRRSCLIRPRCLRPAQASAWTWPLRGQIVAQFSPNQGKKGIDIASKQGAQVFAAADGLVAYAGSGLPGYGNLIIIKHDNEYLTAYGNNSKNWVHEGQRVKRGQKIASTGRLTNKFWGVHFEIRRAGKPVNPFIYLGRN